MKLLTLLFVSVPLFANSFSMKFEAVPKTYNVCHEQASELTKLFISQTGNSSGFVSCLKDDGKKSEYELIYEAETKLEYATTNVFTVIKTGLYKDEASCNLTLQAHTEQFERNTGLKNFVSYCKSDFISDPKRWSPYILAFGTPLKSYWIAGYYYSSVPYKFDSNQFTNSLRISLEKQGAELAGVISTPSLGYGHMGIHYYSKEKIPFQLQELSQSPKIDQCLRDLDRLNKTLKDISLEPVFSYCGKVSMYDQWQVTALFSGSEGPINRPSVETYKSFDECEMDRSRLTTYYKTSVDGRILDGFCSYMDSTFKVLFIRTK